MGNLSDETGKIVSCRCKVAEGPLWHPLKKTLRVDIPEGVIYAMSSKQGALRGCLSFYPESVSKIIIVIIIYNRKDEDSGRKKV